MAVTAAEQYMLELINRARLDPLGEAARYGIGLNDNLATDQLHSGPRSVLAFQDNLELAAIGHSNWMLANDVFSHTGVNGSSPAQRAIAAGYQGWGAGENISWRGTTGYMNLESTIALQHADLFRSASHRLNILYDSYREIGIAQEAGQFTASGTTYNASMVTQNFSSQPDIYYVTGVVYSDTNADHFYSIGEGQGGASFVTNGDSVLSAAAGGYALEAIEGGPVLVQGTVGTKDFAVRIAVDGVNAKLDVVSANTFYASANIALVSGINNVRLLGTGALNASGNSAANVLVGTSARNLLSGAGGNDTLYGRAGNDLLRGGSGQDRLIGEAGNDVLYGDSGNDRMSGGSGTDVFVFSAGAGNDIITDFGSTDRLRFDDAIWSGSLSSAAELVAERARILAGDVVIDLTDGQLLTLDGVSSLSGLSQRIDLF